MIRVFVAMIYLKSALVGIVAAITVTVAYPVFMLALLTVRTAISFLGTGGGGGGGAVSVGVGWPNLGLALVVFAGGFYWEFRRASKRRGRVESRG